MLHLQQEQYSTEEGKTKCTLCNKKGAYQLILSPEHLEVCPGVEVECPNSGCTQLVKRCELLAHRDTCLKEEIRCPFHTMGCDQFKDKREQLGSHIESSIEAHMELVANLGNGVAQQLHPSFEGAPVTLKMDRFKHLKSHNKKWCSNGFYTGPGGYRVRLIVDPNGNGDGKSTHVSVYINLMPGKNDDSLNFPLKGNFRIELLNQVEDNHHDDITVSIPNKHKQFARKREVDETGFGVPLFIKHSSLVDESKGIQYLANDVMYFRVTAKIHSTTKPWLVETVLS